MNDQTRKTKAGDCLRLLAVLFMIGITGCQRNDAITIFAAASTIDALNEVIEEYQDQYSGAESERPIIRTNFAATSTLGNMILNGAEADLFLAADTDWANRIKLDDHLNVNCQNLLSNRLVLIASRFVDLESVAINQLSDLQSATSLKRIAIGDPAHVPAGKYAKALLEQADVWSSIESRIVAGTDVRHVLAMVQQGAADVGIVYVSDLTGIDFGRDESVRLLLRLGTPDSKEQPPIVYSLIEFENPQVTPQVERLLDFLTGERAATIFARHGFGSLQHPEIVVEGSGSQW